MIKTQRLPFLLLAFFSLLIGIVAGLARIGWSISFPNVNAHHGAIMVGGFIGALISLEKVIPLKKRALYFVPLASAASTVLFLFGYPLVAFGLLVLASMGLVVVFSIFLWKDRSVIYAIMLAGALAWFAGNVLLISTTFYPASFNWWMAFVLLIIASERLELMKFLPVTFWSKVIFYLFLSMLILGSLLSFHGVGKVFTGISLAGVGLWLLRNDVVGISIRKSGLTRFVGVTLATGYMWLLLTAVFLLTTSQNPFAYDVVVHAFFIGFVLSMIFAHGPVILPGVLGVAYKPYSSVLYICLAVLHSSLILRVVGDIYYLSGFRKYSGILTALAIISYFATLAYITLRRRNVTLS